LGVSLGCIALSKFFAIFSQWTLSNWLAMTPQMQQFCIIAFTWSGFNKQSHLNALAGIRIIPGQLGWRRPFPIKY
jgi:hypothetical protein